MAWQDMRQSIHVIRSGVLRLAFLQDTVLDSMSLESYPKMS